MSNLTKRENKLIEGKNVLFSLELTLLLLDISGSMSDHIPYDIDDEGNLIWTEKKEFGYQYSKIGAMKDAAVNFVQDRAQQLANGGQDKLGVITFEGEAKMLWELHRDNYDVLIDKIKHLGTGGSTAMYEAILLAMETFARYNDGFFRCVVISDGQPNWKKESLEATQNAFEKYGIITDTIGIGNDCNDTFMQQMSGNGGGEYTKISTYKAMLGIFKQLESERRMLLGEGIKMLGEGNQTKNK